MVGSGAVVSSAVRGLRPGAFGARPAIHGGAASDALPPVGVAPTLLEIPTLELARTMGPEARVRRAAMAARRVIAAAREGSPA